mgnify:CR=1 FL=1
MAADRNQGWREAALTGLVERHRTALVRMCCLCLGDASLAEDAAQETFLRAWRFMDRYKGRGEKTWLMHIALNVCRDIHRSRWHRHVDLTRVLDDLPPSAISVPPQERLLFLDILRLPEKYRQVLLLYYYQDMTLEESAAALGLSRSTAHHRLKRAEAVLRDALTGGDGDEE